MNRKDELTAQIAAHRTTILLLNGQIAQMETELAQTEADAPKPFILREIQPESPAAEGKLVNDLNAVLATEVHFRTGVGCSRRGHAGERAAQTRKINKIVREYTAEQIRAGLAAAKINDDSGHAPAAEKSVARRLGL